MGSDHDYGDGKEDPIAIMALSADLPRRIFRITRELDPCGWSEPLSPPCLDHRGDSIRFRLWVFDLYSFIHSFINITAHNSLPILTLLAA